MSITPVFAASPAVRYRFILIHDTPCHGVVPAEWDGDNTVMLHDTRTEADVECVDAAEMRSEAYREARMEAENDEEGFLVAKAVLHAAGSLMLLDSGRTFTADTLRAPLSQ